MEQMTHRVRLLQSLFLSALLSSATPIGAHGQPADADSSPDAPPEFVLGGSLRTRGEYRYDFKFSPDTPGNTDNFILHQLRLSLRWRPSSSFETFIEGQDAGIHGAKSVDDDSTPNIFHDRIDLHQAYVSYSPALGEAPVSIKLGRQKLALGAERLVGPLEWVNTARAFDGIRLTLGEEKSTLWQGFAMRAVPVDPNGFNSWAPSGNRHANSSLYGIYLSDSALIARLKIEPYYLFRYENGFNDEVHTVGTRLIGTHARWDWNTDAALQFGRFGGLEHRAFAAHAGAGVMLAAAHRLRLALGYSYAQGDDDGTDDEHDTFDNLFPTNHGFYGYMDFFALQNLHNLEVAVSGIPADGVETRLAFHNFWLAESSSDAWYNAGLGVIRPAASEDVSSYVGSELDLTLAFTLLNKQLGLLLGYSHFFTGDYVSETGDSADADYVYLQGKYTF